MTRIEEPVQELAPGICAVIDWQGATMYLDCYPDAAGSDLTKVFEMLRSEQGLEVLDEEDMPVEEQEDGAVRYWLAPVEIQRGSGWE
jgi:hypothetical protein